MFGNFFSFQSKNKDGKPGKEESGKKSGKSGKKSGKDKDKQKSDNLETELLKDEEEQFEDVRGTSSNIDNVDVETIDTSTTISNDLPELSIDRTNRHVEEGGTHSVPELLQQLAQVENEARRLADGLEQVGISITLIIKQFVASIYPLLWDFS